MKSAMMLGRYQPFHKGHKELFKKALEKTGHVTIMVRDCNDENNPFNLLVADITHKCNMECANCYIPNRDIPDIDLFRL